MLLKIEQRYFWNPLPHACQQPSPQFYALYKQAKEGPCSIPKPGFWDVIGKAKWYVPTSTLSSLYMSPLSLLLLSYPFFPPHPFPSLPCLLPSLLHFFLILFPPSLLPSSFPLPSLLPSSLSPPLLSFPALHFSPFLNKHLLFEWESN